jgi:hypothetical protein
MKKIFAALAIAMSVAACSPVHTGYVGLRTDFNNQVVDREITEGQWAQHLVGSVEEFPIREVGIVLNDRRPITAENTPLGDFDATITYNINPGSVSELWAKRSRTFHGYHADTREWHLMETRLVTMADNAILRTIRQYKQLEVNDKRDLIEKEILSHLNDELAKEHIDGNIVINSVVVKAMTPHPDILNSALAVVRTQNDLKVKQNEVDIAKKEAERMAALSANSQQSIAYMDAEARRMMGQAMLAGKVNTIVVPMDFKGIVNVK